MAAPTVQYIPAIKPKAQKLRVAAYCRVSTNSDDQLNSFNMQLYHYKTTIQANPAWTFVDIYADQGLSGTSRKKRNEFNRMMDDCRAKKIDKIIVKSFGRFARNITESLQAIRELKELGIYVYFENANFSTENLTSELLASFYSMQAQEESINISNSVRWSYKKRMENGTFITTYPAYGFDLIDGELIINEKEVIIAKKIFYDYLNGKGLLEIARELTLKKITTKSGNTKWDKSSVLYILTNEKYIGDSLVQKKYTTEFPFEKKLNKGQLPQYYIENTHESIIEKEIFYIIQAMITQKAIPRAESKVYCFSKFITCGNCGSYFKRRIIRGKIYWSCYEHHTNAENCPIKLISEQVIQERFITLLNKLIHNKNKLLLPYLKNLEQLNYLSEENQEIKNINIKIKDLNKQDTTLYRLKAKNAVDPVFLKQKTNEISQQVANLKEKRSGLKQENEYIKIIKKTEHLLNLIEQANGYPYKKFNELLCKEFIDKIIIQDNDFIGYQLINGLIFSEPRKEKL